MVAKQFLRPSRGQVAAAILGLAAPALAAPCDIYWSGGNVCVAAHSTVRSMLDANDGPLYQVQRSSDNTFQDISPLSTGGIANSATQDSFCEGTTCWITIIYDQSGHNNHLTRAPGGGAGNGPTLDGSDNLANATAAPVYLQGHKAYGVFISNGAGYRIDDTTDVPIGNQAEGIYGVFDGRHYNSEHSCCFDYGNAETNNDDDHAGTMEALYFGIGDGWSGRGDGSGPWIMADLEDNLFSGVNTGYNPDPSIPYNNVMGTLKGQPGEWALRQGDANIGSLDTIYSGPRPNGYSQMKKQGAIILGIGGDNSHGGVGTFYEGAIVTGYPSDSTEEQVHANVIDQQYVGGPLSQD